MALEIIWSDFAKIELAETLEYLEENFSAKEIGRLAKEIERHLELISANPKLFPIYVKKGLRKMVILTYNTVYYRDSADKIEIVSFFSNRQNPEKRQF